MGGSQGSPAVTSGSAGTVIHLDACRDASEQHRRDPGSLGRFPSVPARTPGRSGDLRQREPGAVPVPP